MNKLLLFLSMLFAFTLFTGLAFGLTYRDVDNGTWSQFNNEIVDTNYQVSWTEGQTIFNRGFETQVTGLDTNGECVEQWCYLAGTTGQDVPTITTSTDTHRTGSYSLKIEAIKGVGDNSSQAYIFASDEKIGDVNVAFYYDDTTIINVSGNGFFKYGYVDDANTFTERGSITANVTTWTRRSFYVPRGAYRIAFFVEEGTTNGDRLTTYIDDIQILRNNVGTFRANNEPAFCSTTQSCSNIESHLPATQLGDLYHIVEYVAGANCQYRLDKSLSNLALGTGSFSADGTLTEGTSGMYYLDIGKAVTTGDTRDVNIEVTCSKTGVDTVGWFATPTLNKYNNIENGNFETTLNLDVNGECEGDWCAMQFSGAVGLAQTIRADSQYGFTEGQNALRIFANRTTASTMAYVWSQNESVGGYTTYMSYKLSSTQGSNWLAEYGYVLGDTNAFIKIGDLTVNTDWNRFSFDVGAGNRRPAFFIGSGTDASDFTWLVVDNITSSGAKQESDMTVTNDLTSNFGIKGVEYNFYSDYVNTFDNDISDGTCHFVVDGTYYNMVYDATDGRYEYAHTFSSNGTYTIQHGCTSESFNDQNVSYTATIVTPASQTLTITPIENISSVTQSDFSNITQLGLSNNSDAIMFSAVAQEQYTMGISFINYAHDKQYWVYTSNNGTNWTFSESLTFGSSTDYDDPVQKIWNNNHYDYSFNDSLTAGVKKYYKLVYLKVPVYYKNIKNNSDWINLNPPTTYDVNSFIWDLFQDSNYSSIRSYSNRYIPELTSTDFNTGFEFQFTAYASQSTTLNVGYTVGGVDNTETITIGTTPTTFSVPVSPDDYDSKLLFYSSGLVNARVYISNYSLIPRAYFTDRLDIKNLDGSDLTAILVNGSSELYVKEGNPYYLKTSAFDKDGDLESIRFEVLIGTVTINTVEYDLTDAIATNNYYSWTGLTSSVLDLNGYAGYPDPLRQITFRATLINSSGQSVSEQSKTVSIVQYPYFPQDFRITVSSANKKVGDYPEFELTLSQRLPENFIGFNVYVYTTSTSIDSPDYETTIYNTDLGCGFECYKRIVIDDWVWEEERIYFVHFQGLFNTEYPNFESVPSNYAIVVPVSYREYDTMRVLQVFERTDKTYRNDEPIPLVLQMRDVPAISLADRIDAYLTVDHCDGSTGACDLNGTVKFLPVKHVYDKITGYNYWYFNSIFYNDAGVLFDDNYLRIKGHVADKRFGHDEDAFGYPTLVDKCETYNGDIWNAGTFLMNFLSGIGCTNPADAVVTVDMVAEDRLFIDPDHDVNGELNHSLVCVKPDNDIYEETIEQDLFCAVIYRRQEQSIDGFKVFIGNEYSDYAKTGSESQYMEFSIPIEQVIFNDPYLLKASLEADASTDSIDTVGELFYYGIDRIFTGIANPLTEVPTALTDSGVIKNINWDLNWSGTFNPNVFSGVFFIKVEGLKVINQYNYSFDYDDLVTLNPKYFRQFATRNNLFLPNLDTVVTIFGSDMEQIQKFKSQSPLVIFEKPSNTTVKRSSVDENVTDITLPTTLKFDYIVDMLFFNETASYRKHLPLTMTYNVTVPFSAGAFLSGIQELIVNPMGWFEKKWFIPVVLLIFLAFASLIYANFNSGGGNINVNMPQIPRNYRR